MGYKDEMGNIVVPAKYDMAEYFSDGLAEAHLLDEDVNWKYGFIDKGGNQKIPFKYEDCKKYSDGMVAVKFNDKRGYIDAAGKVISPRHTKFIMDSRTPIYFFNHFTIL